MDVHQRKTCKEVWIILYHIIEKEHIGDQRQGSKPIFDANIPLCDNKEYHSVSLTATLLQLKLSSITSRNLGGEGTGKIAANDSSSASSRNLSKLAMSCKL